MGFWNYALTFAVVLGIIGVSLYCRRYIRDVADFLSAGRVAGRYVLCVGSMEEALGLMALLQMMEKNYMSGFAIAFWNIALVAVNMVLVLSGFCVYRFRETRAMTGGQFLEMRYSRGLRVFASVIRSIADILSEILLPAVAARFFIYFFDLPFTFQLCGFEVSTYVVLMIVTLSISLCVIISGGSVALLVSDCLQGLFCYPLFFAIVAFALYTFNWGEHISPTLFDRVPGESFLNPFDVYNLRNFNVFMIFVMATSNVMNRAIWIGSGFSTSARSAHEQKMGGVLTIFRGGFSNLMLVLLGVTLIVMMNHQNFSDKAHATRVQLSRKVAAEVMPELQNEFSARIAEIGEQKHVIGIDPPLSQTKNLDTPYFEAADATLKNAENGSFHAQKFRTLFRQLLFPVAMRNIMPKWLLGLLMMLSVMLMISTDCSRIFMVAAGIAQDLVLPFRKTPMKTEKQLMMIRCFAVLVAIVFFIGSLFMAQVDYLQFFIVTVVSFWTGGAGALFVFGLYSRFGNTKGAFAGLIGGSGFSLVGLLISRNWADIVYPWLDRHGYVPAVGAMFETLSQPFHPFVVWQMSDKKFPINAYEMLFISLIISSSLYCIVSLLTGRGKKFNLEKMLHRGKYADENSVSLSSPWTMKNVFAKLIGITPEYTKSDRVIAWSVFSYTFLYRFVASFVIVLIINLISPWGRELWSKYYFVTLIVVPVMLGLVSTFWFSIGGIIDLRRMFRDLAARKRNFTDDGRVEKDEN